MSLPSLPVPAKLVIGVFTGRQEVFPEVAEELTSHFGTPDIISDWFSFHHTSYYKGEFGGDLKRRMMSFASPIEQDDLSKIKQITNAIEKRSEKDHKRQINIDPGYLVLSRFVLATGKDFAHRIHIGQGIYADLTLVYQKGGFRSLPWTYPDYATDPILTFLEGVRRKYIRDCTPQSKKNFEKGDGKKNDC